jgi:hypothetical protein
MDKKTLRRENETLRQENADLSAKYDALLHVVRTQGELAALGDRSTSIAVSADGRTLETVRHAGDGGGGASESLRRENADLSAKCAALRKLQQKEKECVEAMQTLMGYMEEYTAEVAELVAEQRWGELEDCVARWEDARGK